MREIQQKKWAKFKRILSVPGADKGNIQDQFYDNKKSSVEITSFGVKKSDVHWCK